MRRASIIIAGPADGFIAYRFPDRVVERDDSYALSGSELDLQEGGSAFRISRNRGKNGSGSVRIGLYKQVYEPNLRRAGHTFAAILEFSDTIPTLDSALEVLTGLLVLIGEHCVDNGVFCDQKAFDAFLTNFLSSTLGNGIPKVFAQLKDSSARALPFISSESYPIDSYVKLFEEARSERHLIALWEWFLYSIGGCLLVSVLAAQAAEAATGTSSSLLPDVSGIDEVAGRTLVKKLDDVQTQLERRDIEVADLLSDKARLISGLNDAEGKIRSLNDSNIRLQRHVTEGEVKRKPLLTDSDLIAIRGIVSEAVRSNIRPQTLPARIAAESDGDWLIYLYWAIGFVVLVFLAGLAYYFLAR